MSMKVIDATNCVLGRLSTFTAKELLKVETIAIVNAEKAFISGSRDSIVGEYKRKRELGTQRKGPFYPRVPDRILKRTVRGMLPYQKPNGREAYKRLKVYIGVPEEFKDKSAEKIDKLVFKGTKGISLGELSGYLGFRVLEKNEVKI